SVHKPLASKSTTTAGKSRRKTLSPFSEASSSLLAPSNKDSSNSNPETSNESPSPNEKQQPQQQPVLVHFKHPTQTLSTTSSAIQMANTMTSFLSTAHTSSTDNNTLSSVSTTTPTMVTTTLPTSPNQKIRVVYNSPLYRTVLPTSTGGQQQQFPQIQLLSIKQSPSSSATPTSFKIISNKLPMVNSQGSSQPLLIPMAVSNNQGTVFSVKAPTSSAAITTTSIAQPTTAAIVTSDFIQGININNTKQSLSDSIDVATPKTIDSELVKNEDIDEKSENIIKSSDNSADNSKMDDSVSTETLIFPNSNEKTKESASDLQTSKEEIDSKPTTTRSIIDTSMMKPTLQTDNPSSATNKVTIQPQTSIARTVFMLPSGSDSIVGSNVVILKADSSRLSKSDNVSTTTNSLGNSNLRRHILISKPSTHHHLYTSNQDSTSNTTTQQQGSIYATKSANNSKTVTATKTLPSILRQRKRKNDTTTISQQQLLQTSNTSTITIDPVKPSLSSIEQTAQIVPVTTNDCSVLLSSESDDPESHSTPTVQQHGSVTFKQQKYKSILSTSPMNDDDVTCIDTVNVSDQTDSAATKPLKRARKSKITTIQQHHIGSMALPTASPVYVNFVTNPCSDLQTSKSNQDDKNETTPTVTNSRILRNSSTLTLQPNTQSSPKTIVKRGQRNQRATSIPAQMTEATSVSVSMFTTTSANTINESIKLNDKPKRGNIFDSLIFFIKINYYFYTLAAAIGNQSGTPSNRQTRYNRGRKKPTESSPLDQTMTNAGSMINSSDPVPVSETFATVDTVNVDQQQTQSLINPNLIDKNPNSSSTMLTHNNSTATTSSAVSNNPTITHPINVISVSNSVEPLVSLLDNSNNVNTTAGNNPVTTTACGNNNSLLVKRSRKTILTAVTSTATIHSRPSLRNSSVTETISPPPPSAKRRRLAKDVSK
ncbi:hypothetical protein BLA29_001956, partial [Euroglyphus maynei]